jgi:hypothetical protein
MRRPRYLLTGTAVLGLVLAACGSPALSELGPSSGSEPSAAAQASPAGGDAGGGAGGIGITLADGTWSSGNLQVTVSGDASGTYDAPLVGIAGASYTTGGETILSYVDAEAQVSVGVAIYTDSFAISVTTTDLVAGAGTTLNCSVEYHSADDHTIDADFSCPNSPAFTTTGTAGGTVDIEGSLTATR